MRKLVIVQKPYTISRQNWMLDWITNDCSERFSCKLDSLGHVSLVSVPEGQGGCTL